MFILACISFLFAPSAIKFKTAKLDSFNFVWGGKNFNNIGSQLWLWFKSNDFISRNLPQSLALIDTNKEQPIVYDCLFLWPFVLVFCCFSKKQTYFIS